MSTRVLIVDDDADLAESLAEILLDHGCVVSLAEHGQEAVERARAQQFDIIFMDVRMPVMNGVDAFFAIRALRPRARVVMMTGFKETFVERAIQAGAEGPLHKPFAVDEMLALIEQGPAAPPLRPAGPARQSPRLVLVARSPSGTIH
jgi:two-component system response regulator (stage 0 sporulation protein F)